MMIMACALLHNFIRLEFPIDLMEDELSDGENDDNEEDNVEFIDTVESSQAWNNWRDNLANSMYYECRGLISKDSRKRNEKGRRSCCRREEEVLVAALTEIVCLGWKSENGFKIGYLQAFEQEIAKVDANARLMRFKSWPHYSDWVNNFGKDRATGEHAECFTKGVNHVLNGMSTPDEEHTNQFKNLFEECNDETETMSVYQPENTPGNSESIKKNSGRKRKYADF
ncbi:hypothetical protein DH2020_045499 [Rehmannia glutinosa]|uniref:Nuclease n=1 Tax=Rehmannia glutinosa TaxID=99300 RepID=A0ABR0UDZ8_REHGL